MTKTVLITGGTRGVGQALVDVYLEQGFEIVATGTSENSVGLARERYPDVEWHTLNMAQASSIRCFAAQLGSRKLDIVIHNAGVQQLRNLFDPAQERLSVEEETTVNFIGPITLTQALFQNVAQCGGTWIFVTSGLAIAPKQSAPIYCANKAGLRVFCKAFNGQVKQYNGDVRVCEAILPLVDTDMTKGRGKGKISPLQAAKEIARGAQKGKKEIYVGKVKLFMRIRSLFPNFIENILLTA